MIDRLRSNHHYATHTQEEEHTLRYERREHFLEATHTRSSPPARHSSPRHSPEGVYAVAARPRPCCIIIINRATHYLSIFYLSSIYLFMESLDQSLFAAAVSGAFAELQSLLDRKASVNVCDDNADNPIHLAALHGYRDCVELLLERQADFTVAGNNLDTPLHYACFNGHYECAVLLLDRQANVNAINDFNATPLHYASGGGHLQCIGLLVDHGADKTITNVSVPLSCSCSFAAAPR